MLSTEIDQKSFEFFAEQAPDIIECLDENLIRCYLNASVTTYTGMPADYFTGKHFLEGHFFSESAEILKKLVNQALQNKTMCQEDVLIRTSIGERYFHIRALPQTSEETVKKIFIVFRDITEVRTKESLLNKVTDRFSTAAEALLQPFVILLPLIENNRIIDFEYDYINDIGCKINGVSREETIGRRLLDLFPAHKELGTFDAFCNVFETSLPYRDTIKYKGAAGSGFLDGYFTISAAKIEDGLVVTWQDITDVVTAQNEIKKSEERLFIAFNANPVSMILTDAAGRIMNVNRRFRQLLGYTKKEVIGKTSRELDLFAEKEYLEKIESGIMLKEPLSRQSTRIKDNKGEILDVISATVPIETSGNVNFLFTLVDVTKEKTLEKSLVESLREKDVLIKEIHHRVKNNLQIISSLLNLQASITSSPEGQNVISETQNRIQSIALMHENLYRNKSLSSINLQDYLSGMLNRLHQTYTTPGKVITTSVDAGDINIDLKQCVSIGLIVNELVSNSYKYAFIKSQRGEISVIARKKRGGTIELIIADNGVGLPKDMDFDQPDSLGLQLVSILANQLDGTVRGRSINGAEFTLIFPQNS